MPGFPKPRSGAAALVWRTAAATTTASPSPLPRRTALRRHSAAAATTLPSAPHRTPATATTSHTAALVLTARDEGISLTPKQAVHFMQALCPASSALLPADPAPHWDADCRGALEHLSTTFEGYANRAWSNPQDISTAIECLTEAMPRLDRSGCQRTIQHLLGVVSARQSASDKLPLRDTVSCLTAVGRARIINTALCSAVLQGHCRAALEKPSGDLFPTLASTGLINLLYSVRIHELTAEQFPEILRACDMAASLPRISSALNIESLATLISCAAELRLPSGASVVERCAAEFLSGRVTGTPRSHHARSIHTSLAAMGVDSPSFSQSLVESGVTAPKEMAVYGMLQHSVQLTGAAFAHATGEIKLPELLELTRLVGRRASQAVAAAPDLQSQEEALLKVFSSDVVLRKMSSAELAYLAHALVSCGVRSAAQTSRSARWCLDALEVHITQGTAFEWEGTGLLQIPTRQCFRSTAVIAQLLPPCAVLYGNNPVAGIAIAEVLVARFLQLEGQAQQATPRSPEAAVREACCVVWSLASLRAPQALLPPVLEGLQGLEPSAFQANDVAVILLGAAAVRVGAVPMLESCATRVTSPSVLPLLPRKHIPRLLLAMAELGLGHRSLRRLMEHSLTKAVPETAAEEDFLMMAKAVRCAGGSLPAPFLSALCNRIMEEPRVAASVSLKGFTRALLYSSYNNPVFFSWVRSFMLAADASGSDAGGMRPRKRRAPRAGGRGVKAALRRRSPLDPAG